MTPVVCIAAAGKGTRANSKWHKALLPINDKAVISHIIDSFHASARIVIAVGHQKEIIKAYCNAAHNDRMITYVDVDNYDGKGSGPGYSMNCCRKYLQQPFWFITCDCIVSNEPTKERWWQIKENWLGVCNTLDPSKYSTVQVDLTTSNVTDFVNKSFNGYDKAYIGFCGIKDYTVFWEAFDAYLSNKTDEECEHVGVFYDINKWKDNLSVKLFPSWKDTGSIEGYERAKMIMKEPLDYHFEKTIDEITYQFPAIKYKYTVSRVVKLDHSEKIAKKAHRAKLLKDIVPECHIDNNILYYSWVNGKLLYEVDKTGVFLNFVNWCQKVMWQNKVTCYGFKESCLMFYRDKTFDRLKKFNQLFPDHATTQWTMANCMLPSMAKILDDMIDWYSLSDGIPVIGHGDLNFGNAILEEDEKSFKLIDWREEFADQPDCLDVYYDLAKLYAGVDVSWMKIHQHMHRVNTFLAIDGTDVKLCNDSYTQTPDLVLFKGLFEKWIVDNGYDLKRVKTIAALIYLNMSPLHGKEMGEFLFFLALERLSHVTVH